MDEAAAPGWAQTLGSAMALTGRDPSRLVRAAAAVSVGVAALNQARGLRQRWRNAREWQIVVPGDDDLYEPLLRRVIELIPRTSRRSFTARTTRTEHGLVEPGRRPAPQVAMAFDTRRSGTVRIGGHTVRIVVEHEETRSGGYTDGESSPYGRRQNRIVLATDTLPAQQAVLEWLDEINRDRHQTRLGPAAWIADRWGGWDRIGEIRPRPMDTVVLAPGQMERLVDDIDTFQRLEADYDRLGVPWHRGFVFEGPPGTGKTSAARALAAHYDMDLYLMPLSDVTQDTHLLAQFSRVPQRSILLIEDIDVAHAATVRDDDARGVTMSGLLNALDGVTTPHGLVTIMTTNALDALDPALLRPGRADRIEHFGYADSAHAARIVEALTGATVDIPDGMSVAPAAVVEALKPTLGMSRAETVRYLNEHFTREVAHA